jgi:ribosomal protein L37AE/L43A
MGEIMTYFDVTLWILASPILFVQWLRRLMWKRRYWKMYYTPKITCGNCQSTIYLVGIWQCPGCKHTFKGHLMHPCRVCGSVPRFVRCYECNLTEKLPEKL